VTARTEGGGGLIVEVLPRATVLARLTLRGDTEIVAANLSQLIAVVAPVPEPDFGLCDRYLAAAAWCGLDACIVANKCELAFPAAMEQALEEYRRIGYESLCTSTRAADGASLLRQRLVGTTSVLVGQSGVGKSALLNLLVPGVEAAVDAVSRALAAGRHTTTTSSLHAVPSGGELIDSPGVRDFSPPLPAMREIASGYREIARFDGQCRFRDCLHRREPGCAVAAVAADGTIAARRLASYRRLLTLAEEMTARAAPRLRR
jgi:ribosome biogenesis GTPase